MKDDIWSLGDYDGVRYAYNICWFYSVKFVYVAPQEMESWLCQCCCLNTSLGLLYWAVTNWSVHNFQSCLIVLLLWEHGLHYLRATTWLTTMQSCCYGKDSKKACWWIGFWKQTVRREARSNDYGGDYPWGIFSYQTLLLKVHFSSVKHLSMNVWCRIHSVYFMLLPNHALMFSVCLQMILC